MILTTRVPFIPKQRFDIPFGKVTDLPADQLLKPLNQATPATATIGGSSSVRAPIPPNGLQGRQRAPGSQQELSPGMTIPDAEGPTSVGGPEGPTPLVPPPAASGQGKRSEADDDAPVRVLSSRVVNAFPASNDTPPLTPTASQPLLGIFSGKPMPDHVVWPSIFATGDRPSPDDDGLYQRWRRWLDA
jgi:hypothetical protein